MSNNPGVDLQTAQAALDTLVRKLELSISIKVGKTADRYRFIIALQAVASFLDDMEADREYQDIFLSLAFALADLDEGIVDPALCPVKRPKGGHTNDPSSWWLHRARICVAMEGLIVATGRSLGAVADMVVEKHPKKVAAISRSGMPSARTVRDWYDEFASGGPKGNEYARDYFKSHAPQTLHTRASLQRRGAPGICARRAGEIHCRDRPRPT